MRSMERNSAGGHVQAAELCGGGLKIQAPAQGVEHRLRLLENFLEHEMRVLAALRVLLGKFQVADLHVAVSAPRFNHVKPFGGDGGHVIIIQVNHFFGVGDNGVGVAGHKMFLPPMPMMRGEPRRAATSRSGEIGADDGQPVGADDFAQGVAYGAWVSRFACKEAAAGPREWPRRSRRRHLCRLGVAFGVWSPIKCASTSVSVSERIDGRRGAGAA
jgi:hypothetical protein